MKTGVFGWVGERTPQGISTQVPLVVLEVEGDPAEVIKQLQKFGNITLKSVLEVNDGSAY